jgi:DMSO/TMAO reductase YedYZ molybdopterin-dependent catalytic subunit
VTEPTNASREQRAYGRRAFLGTTAVGLSSLFWGEAVWRRVAHAAAPLTAALPPSLVPHGWRIYTVSGSMPHFDPQTWRLEVGGLVERPLSLDDAALRGLPSVRQVSTFHCVTGWTVDDVHWGGVRLRDLLALARPAPDAGTIAFVSAEVPYVDTLSRDQAGLHDVLLAYEMDGRPLPREHGAPLRLVVPEMYGYKSVKWVRRIVVGREPFAGYWEQRGYDVDAWIGRSNGY